MCKEPKELKETIDDMLSSDYKERFKAEYYQTKIRYTTLQEMIFEHYSSYAEDPFTQDCDLEIILEQAKCMAMYLICLEKRAKIEKIDIVPYL